MEAGQRTFFVQELLGAGSFGEVYRATMQAPGGLRTEVALKMLHDPRVEAVNRMREEGRLLASLRHPAILKVHDLTTIDGRATLVTEFVEGADLSALQAQHLSTRLLLEVVGSVADALHTAWSSPGPEGGEPLRLVHRDVKPSNIRVGRHGEIKLLDFGIAWSAGEGRHARTQANAMVGSLAYMAPERFTGAPVEHSSDVYSLGCVLYEGLVGERLIGVDTAAQAAMLASQADRYASHLERRLALVPPDTPPEVLDLLRRMVAYDPAARPDARSVAATCERLIDDLHGPRLTSWAREREWHEEHPTSGPLTGRSLGDSSIPGWAGLAPARSRDDETATRTIDGAELPGLAGTMAGPPRPAQATTGTRPRARIPLAAAGVVVAVACGVAAAAWWARTPPAESAPEGEIGHPAPVEPAPSTATPTPVVPVEAAPAAAEPQAVPAAAPSAPRRSSTRSAAPSTPSATGAGATPPSAPVVEPPAPEVAAGGAAPGQFRAVGDVRVRLKGPAGTFGPGPVPAGTYEIEADFGKGPTPVGRTEVRSGHTITVRCNPITWTCEESGPR